MTAFITVNVLLVHLVKIGGFFMFRLCFMQLLRPAR